MQTLSKMCQYCSGFLEDLPHPLAFVSFQRLNERNNLFGVFSEGNCYGTHAPHELKIHPMWQTLCEIHQEASCEFQRTHDGHVPTE